MVATRITSTTMLSTASGLRNSLRMPSRKKVVDWRIFSCCCFSSAVAGSNFLGSIWRLRRFFFGSLSALY